MSIREAVKDFPRLGPLPDSDAAEEVDLDHRVAVLKRIVRPMTDEESLVLAESFGPDECYGVAWSLLHLAETAPGRPRPPDRVFERSEFLRRSWKGATRT